MLPCTPQLPAQHHHLPSIQQLQNSNQTKRLKFQGWQEWHSRRQYLAHSRGVEGGREGSRGHVSELWSSQDCKSSNSLTACWVCHGRSNMGAGTAACLYFQHIKPLPSLFLLPFPNWLIPLLHRQAWGLPSHQLWGQLSLPASHPFTCPQEKCRLIKHQSPSQGCTSSWVHSGIMPGLADHGTSPSNTR